MSELLGTRVLRVVPKAAVGLGLAVLVEELCVPVGAGVLVFTQDPAGVVATCMPPRSACTVGPGTCFRMLSVFSRS